MDHVKPPSASRMHWGHEPIRASVAAAASWTAAVLCCFWTACPDRNRYRTAALQDLAASFLVTAHFRSPSRLHWGHEPIRASVAAAASWTAAVLCRFWTACPDRKRQRTAALQDLAESRTVHGKISSKTPAQWTPEPARGIPKVWVDSWREGPAIPVQRS